MSRQGDELRITLDTLTQQLATEREKVKGLEALLAGSDGQDEVVDIKLTDYYALGCARRREWQNMLSSGKAVDFCMIVLSISLALGVLSFVIHLGIRTFTPC